MNSALTKKDGTYSRLLNKNGSDAHWCDQCKSELAANSCIDAVERFINSEPPTTKWMQGNPRYGCLKHPVEPMVIWLNGKTMTFAAYKAETELCDA